MKTSKPSKLVDFRKLFWIKASVSATLGACVELVAVDSDLIALRDSKDPGIVLHFTHLEIAAFFHGVKRGEFDHLLASGDPTELLSAEL